LRLCRAGVCVVAVLRLDSMVHLPSFDPLRRVQANARPSRNEKG
jgi:hypothetical protein